MMSKTAFITGVSGQDGSYLAEFLLEQGYEVHGLVRRHSTENLDRLRGVLHSDYYNKKFFLHYADMTDSSNMHRLITEICPDEVYNLAAQSHVGISFEVPEYTAEARKFCITLENRANRTLDELNGAKALLKEFEMEDSEGGK